MSKYTVYGLPGVYNSIPLTLNEGDGVALAVDISGRLIVSDTVALTTTEQKAATGTVSQVGDSATSVTLKAANTSRKGLSVFNDSTAILYLATAATASTTAYTVQLQQGDYWETVAKYTGIVTGIWASDAGGNAYVTEYT